MVVIRLTMKLAAYYAQAGSNNAIYTLWNTQHIAKQISKTDKQEQISKTDKKGLKTRC